jgi:hypothetical protein
VLFTRNLAKLYLQFSEFLRFSRNFLRISKSLSLLEIHFTPRSLELFKGLQVYPCCADGSMERIGNSQWSAWAPVGAGPAKIRRTGGRVRLGAGGGRPAGPWALGYCARWGRGTTGGRGRRSGAVVVAGASAPAKLRLRRGNRWFGR